MFKNLSSAENLIVVLLVALFIMGIFLYICPESFLLIHDKVSSFLICK